MTQRVWNPAKRASETMSITHAAHRFGVPYQTWHAWEREDGDPLWREPDRANKKKLFLFTGGALRPDHFHPIDEWREELRRRAEAEAAAAEAGAAHGAAIGAPERGHGRARGEEASAA